jgi:hypothetical protein
LTAQAQTSSLLVEDIPFPNSSRDGIRIAELERQLNENLDERVRNTQAISACVKRLAPSPGSAPQDPQLVALVARESHLEVQGEAARAELMALLGVSQADLDRLERLRLPSDGSDPRYDRRSLVNTPSTGALEDLAAVAFERLVSFAPPGWLREQRKLPYRLAPEVAREGLRIAGGIRLRGVREHPPQRFAHMLLLLEDFIEGRPELDFFNAALLVPEAAMLGAQLEAIPELGPAAVKKLHRLYEDTDVASSMYELLVGAACVRKGTRLEMLIPAGSGKSPDFRVHWKGPPTVIECKRKADLSAYARGEAQHMFRLFDEGRQLLEEFGAFVSLEIDLVAEAQSVTPDDFKNVVRKLLVPGPRSQTAVEPWGTIRCRPLPTSEEMALTRLFSPNFLERVYGWRSDPPQWDGMICCTEQPSTSLVVGHAASRSLKWRTHSNAATVKKARGINDLLGRAFAQVPDGEMGILYVSYVESGREATADARTEHILKLRESWTHRWGIKVPLVRINRIYPRSLGDGQPDLLDSVISLVDGDHSIQAHFGSCVFANPPR